MVAAGMVRTVIKETSQNYSDLTDLTVVIPTLNEAEAIGKVIDEILSLGIPHSNVLVVDGGSSDGTVEIVKSKGIRLVFQRGKGKADAIRTSLEYVTTQYILFMDGDYTYPANHIRDLYRKAKEGYDLVIGARIFTSVSQPFIYRVGNKLLTFLFNLMFGSHLSDVLSGMYIVRKRLLETMKFTSRGFGIETEIVAHALASGSRVAEVPISYRSRLGRKKLNPLHGFHILYYIVKFALKYKPLRAIVILFSLLFALLMIIALLVRLIIL